MAKKSKKRQSRKKRSSSANVQSTAPAATEQKRETGFNPDYTETVKDLKRIGILAGTFFAILLGLSFFLN